MAPRRDPNEKALATLSSVGVIAPPPIQVESPKFSGSLAALFVCVRDRKVDLLDIPLFPICSAYFLYLAESEQISLDEAAAALTALAYLLERKAWALLPVAEPEPEFDDPMELMEPYVHEFALAIEQLRTLHEERTHQFFRPQDAGPDPYELPYTLEEIEPADLARALARLLSRATPEKPEVLGGPRRSLTEQMKLVLAALTTDWASLDSLVKEPFTRQEAVWWFLALLELIRLGQVNVQVSEEDVQFRRKV
ncbi:MAG: hypothetical protein KF784_07525 [Fimbriimonadaceae bacterium]|nr:hypothetical protein [Fimbriimonadaceae bacterium]